MLPFCWSGGVPENCCFTKLWRFGDSAFPAFGGRGTSAVKQSGWKKEKHYEILSPSPTQQGETTIKLIDNMRNYITVKYHNTASNDVNISDPYCGKYIRYIREPKREERGKSWKWNCDTGSILKNPQKAVSAYKQGLKYKVPERTYQFSWLVAYRFFFPLLLSFWELDWTQIKYISGETQIIGHQLRKMTALWITKAN